VARECDSVGPQGLPVVDLIRSRATCALNIALVAFQKVTGTGNEPLRQKKGDRGYYAPTLGVAFETARFTRLEP
jgi:hypothetical protein